MIIVGGLGSIWGAVLGALMLSYINYYFIPDVFNTLPSKIGLDFNLTQLSFGIFGFLLVLVMVLRPQGLFPERRRRLELGEGIGAGEDAEIIRGEGVSNGAERDRPTPAAPSGDGDILTAEDVSKDSAGSSRSTTCRFAIPPQLDRLDHRAQRRRQDDFLQHADRPVQADHGPDRASTDSDVTRARPDKITALGMARTFQNIRLFAAMTALENVMVGRHARMKRRAVRLDLASAMGPAGRSATVNERARELLDYVGLQRGASFDQLAINLSYGDQRRVEIARALASDPSCCCSTSRPPG